MRTTVPIIRLALGSPSCVAQNDVETIDCTRTPGVIDGIGQIAFPPGSWTVEHVVRHDKNVRSPDVYVFKKAGDRLERLTVQRFGPHISHPIAAYFDSIGDSMSEGIPIQLLDWKNAHDTTYILRPVVVRERSGDREICMVATYLCTGETDDPWMSHAFVCDRDGWLLVCVHASPHVISPETVDQVFSKSKFVLGTRELTEGHTKR